LSTQISPAVAVAGETVPAVRAFARLLRAYASSTRLLSASLQAEHGLTINDYEALLLLSRAEGNRMRRVDLARRLILTPSGVTRLLEGLEEAGLVERKACSFDQRVSYAQLTDAGSARLREASCAHIGSIRTLFEEHLSEEEIEELAATLAKLPGAVEGDDACAATGA
jgi:DNA-binding MarR family transcriptional regulator